MCILRNIFLNSPLFKQETIKDIRKYFKLINFENTTCHNLWDAVKAILRENCSIYSAYIRKEDWNMNDLNSYLTKLEK